VVYFARFFWLYSMRKHEILIDCENKLLAVGLAFGSQPPGKTYIQGYDEKYQTIGLTLEGYDKYLRDILFLLIKQNYLDTLFRV